MTPRPDLSGTQVGELKQLFERALASPRGQRGTFVAEACSGDLTLQDELSSLLDAHDASDGFFEQLAEELIGPALSAIEVYDHDEAALGESRVSHYELLERIGIGGMGVVYKARDTRLGRTVALKFLPRRHASSPTARARLLAEARAASALDHANIGVVHEIGEAEDGRQFIAMTWYEGETLRARLRRGPVPAQEAVAIAMQLGSALAAAHAAGIVHRDVKPSNVIITQSRIVKLVDFGIAKLMSADDGETHAVAGTIAYMSPEQTRETVLDGRSDIWSLGVLLYETLAGKRPFRGDTDELIVSAIRNDEPAPLLLVESQLPPKVIEVVDRCLRKNPADRYQTAEQLCDALSELVNDRRDPDSRDDNHSALMHTHPRSNTARVAALSVILLIGAATWGYSRYSRTEGKVSATAAAPILSVAVLPFGDSASNDSSRYLAEALGDELRTELSRSGGALTVPGYLSSAPYPAAAASLQQTAAAMGANFIVTGNVQRSNGATRVSVRLADGKTGRQLSLTSYDAEPGAVPSIVSNSAKRILTVLDAGLSSEEMARVARPPTTNARAYDLYLRGRYAELSGLQRNALAPMPVENMRRAQALYAQARTLDPAFAAARARLAVTHMFSAGSYDTTQARVDQARVEAEAALRLDPRLSDSQEALSAYWSRQGNEQRAIEELESALRSAPNNVSLLLALGMRYVVTGRWEDGIALTNRALRLDPRNPRAAWQAATSYGRMRRSPEAMRAFNQLIDISPDDHEVKVIKGQSYLRWKGSPDTLSEMLRRIPADWDDRGMATYGRYTALRVERRFRDALSMLDRSRSDLSRDGLVYHPKSLMRAELYHALGDDRRARLYYTEAVAVMSDSSMAHPKDASIHAALGLAYAGLGRKRRAIDEVQQAMDLVRVSRNSRNATAFMGLAVEVFGRVGERDRAFEMIELMLSMPSGREVTIPFLRVWPGFDPLRGDPRLDQLIARFTPK